MAQSIAEFKYVSGSAALQLDYESTAAPRDDSYELPSDTAAQEAREEARVRERVRTHEASIERARQRQAISPAALLGFGLVALLMVFVLLSYVRLTVITNEITALNNQIAELESASRKLAVEYETTFNLNEVKEYASSRLGMKQLTEADVTRFYMTREDKGVVLNQDDARGLGIISAARDFLSSLTEYLR